MKLGGLTAVNAYAMLSLTCHDKLEQLRCIVGPQSGTQFIHQCSGGQEGVMQQSCSHER